MKHDWWKTFFDDKIGDFLFGSISRSTTASEIKTILKYSKLPQWSDVLDLACGRGRHTIELARQRYSVTGLDYSRDYLKTAQRRVNAGKFQDRARLVHGDMRRLSPRFGAGSFDMVMSLYNSFGYFSRRTDDQKVLNEVARVLKPKGLLVLNTLNHGGVEHRLCGLPASANLPGIDRWEQRSRKEFFLDRARYDARKKEIHVDWHFLNLKTGRDHRCSFQQNVYSAEELQKMLKKAGFAVIRRWGRLDGGKFTATSWHQTVLARKTK